MSPTQRRIRLAFGRLWILVALVVICAPGAAVVDAASRPVCEDTRAEPLVLQSRDLSEMNSQALQVYVKGLDQVAETKIKESAKPRQAADATPETPQARADRQLCARAISQAYSAAKHRASQIHPCPKHPHKPADCQADPYWDAMKSDLRALRESVCELLSDVGLRQIVSNEGDGPDCYGEVADSCWRREVSSADSRELWTQLRLLQDLAKKKIAEWKALSENAKATKEKAQVQNGGQATATPQENGSATEPKPKPQKDYQLTVTLHENANAAEHQAEVQNGGQATATPQESGSATEPKPKAQNNYQLTVTLHENANATEPEPKTPSNCQTAATLQDCARSIFVAYRYVERRESEIRRCVKDRCKCCPTAPHCPADTDLRLMRSDRRELRERVNELLSDVGLRQTVSAQLVTGLIAGAVPSKDSSTGATGTLPEAYLAFASRSAMLIEKRPALGEWLLDVNVGGRFGFVPALSLLSPTPTGSTVSSAASSGTDGPPAAHLQQAFIWEAGGMMNLHLSPSFEVSLIAQGGQINADSQSSIQGTGKDASLVVPLSGDSAFRWHWSAGVRARLLASSQTPQYLQELNGLVAPALEASLFYKHENRFADRNGAIVPESGWPKRFAFRLMLNSIPVKRSDSAPGAAAVFTISFGVEYEARWLSNHDKQNIPSVTRVLIHGDLDLLKVLKGGG